MFQLATSLIANALSPKSARGQPRARDGWEGNVKVEVITAEKKDAIVPSPMNKNENERRIWIGKGDESRNGWSGGKRRKQWRDRYPVMLNKQARRDDLCG